MIFNCRLLACKGFMWLADFICRKKFTTSESLLSSFYFQINMVSRRKVNIQ
uniref:Uncharacterized protein n=1 Tax=Arundo donax TaxID=35708 RepID=A0A0A9D8X4_ARUDO